MPSPVTLVTPIDNQTDVSSAFWMQELGKIVNALNQLIAGTFGSTSLITTGDVTARDVTATRNVSIGGTLSVTGLVLGTLAGATLNFTTILLGGVACDAALGLVTLTAAGIVKGIRLGTRIVVTDNTVNQAATDGTFEGIISSTSGWGQLDAYYGTTSSPATACGHTAATYEYGKPVGSFSARIKKGEYYKGVFTNGFGSAGSKTYSYAFIPEGD